MAALFNGPLIVFQDNYSITSIIEESVKKLTLHYLSILLFIFVNHKDNRLIEKGRVKIVYNENVFHFYIILIIIHEQ